MDASSIFLFVLFILVIILYFCVWEMRKVAPLDGPKHVTGIVTNIETVPPTLYSFTFSNGELSTNELQTLDPSKDYTFLYRNGELKFVA